MTDDPVADADAHLERIDAESDHREKLAKMYREIITETLTNTIRTVKYSVTLALPATKSGKIFYESLHLALADYLGYGKPLHSLMEVLTYSTCPLVANLRQALADNYSDANADDLAEASL